MLDEQSYAGRMITAFILYYKRYFIIFCTGIQCVRKVIKMDLDVSRFSTSLIIESHCPRNSLGVPNSQSKLLFCYDESPQR